MSAVSLLPLRRTLAMIFRAAAGLTVTRIVLLVLQGVLPLVALYLMKLIVDAVQAAIGSNDASAFRHIAWLIAIAGGVALATAAIRALASLVSDAQTFFVSDYLHGILHEKSSQMDLQYYEQAEYYDRLHRAQQQSGFRTTRIVNSLASLLQSGVSLIGMAGLLFAFNPLLAVVLLTAVIPGAYVRVRHSRRAFHWERRRTPAEREARYFDVMLTGHAHAKELRIFHLGPLFIQRFRDVRNRIRGERLRLNRQRALGDLASQVAATLAVFGGFAYIAWRAVRGTITLGDMVMYYGAFQSAQNYFRDMLGGVTQLYEDNLFLTNFYEFLDLEPKVLAPERPRAFPRPIRRGIVFQRVSFKYPTSGVEVLRGVDLVIAPGEHVALVGPNGSGKTTLVKLLCRLYDPTEGAITIDGIDLRELDPAELRRQISIVFQDYARFNLTARENIAFGDAWSQPSNQRIQAAAQHAGADVVISRLERGYDSVLGHLFLDGVELSIGEWQKVALARAFLRDSAIIVFDEPTSALDARAEYEVFESLHGLSRGRAALMISHRLSTVRMADRICVLDEGRIVEAGAHVELVERGGTYAQLFETQARYYR
ncbi:MAG: ABC transporter ATP-binding protein [Longimicrobiales bacterium]